MNARALFAPFVIAVVAACGSKSDTPQPVVTASTNRAAPTPPSDTSLLRADKARIQGSDAAKVWVVMSSDFQCPFCKAFHDSTYQRILQDYVKTGKVKFAYINHPMPFHQFAMPAAEAAMCAGKQDRFWEMHDRLYATQDAWTKQANPQPSFDAIAGKLGLRMDDWRSCVSTHATQALIEADLARSKAAGVSGTPSFVIGGQLAIVGAQPWEDFKRAIDQALAQAGGK